VTLAIIDAHHHLWDLEQRAYPFLDAPEHAPIRRDFSAADLRETVAAQGVVETVVVQAAPEVAETESLLGAAAATPLIGAVVGWIEFDAQDARAQLDGLLAHPQGSLLAGVRAMAQDHSDPDWLASDAVAHGAACVGAAGLVCELLITPRELAAARELVLRLPEVSFVIDHAAKPPIDDGVGEPWLSGIRALAEAPNTTCKVSGLITEADWDSWTRTAIAPFVEVVAEAFGEERLLFGSDWPVCLLAGRYEDVVELARETLHRLPAEQVFAANARRIYGLPRPGNDPG
jgi:L-fuconolactonase